MVVSGAGWVVKAMELSAPGLMTKVFEHDWRVPSEARVRTALVLRTLTVVKVATPATALTELPEIPEATSETMEQPPALEFALKVMVLV